MVSKNSLEFIPFKNICSIHNFQTKYEKVNFSEVNPSDTFFHFFSWARLKNFADLDIAELQHPFSAKPLEALFRNKKFKLDEIVERRPAGFFHSFNYLIQEETRKKNKPMYVFQKFEQILKRFARQQFHQA